MSIRVISGIFLGAMLLLASACLPVPPPAARAPNSEERDAFLKSQGLRLITDKLAGDSLIVLHENATEYGASVITIPPTGGLTASTGSMLKSRQPVLVLTQLTESHPFAAVFIQDPSLVARTTSVEIEIDSQNRLTATTDGRIGTVLVSPSPVKDWKSVALSNAQGYLYRQQRRLQHLRITNSGSAEIKGLVVLFPGPNADAPATRIEFGDVTAGTTTEYRAVPSGVYRYAAYAYTLDGRPVVQPVTDWVGESPMSGEKFTYRIALDPSKPTGNQVELIEVIVDTP